jgi:2-oxo-4-hydroxy-4-carboxy-5-ureidoimidazoline decarboxylase
MRLTEFNALDAAPARDALERCCHARAWIEAMVAARPFEETAAALAASDAATRALTRDGLFEAFAGHPRIGERVGSAWSQQEQSGVEDQTREALIEANRRYEERFGHVFLIKATGRSGEEMLGECLRRIANEPDAELEEAREQLVLINQIRVLKLLEE